jgi:hypothetical protein
VPGLALKEIVLSILNPVKLNALLLPLRIIFRALATVFAVICHCLDVYLSVRRLRLLILSLYSRSYFRILFHPPLPLCKGDPQTLRAVLVQLLPPEDKYLLHFQQRKQQRVKPVPAHLRVSATRL